MKAYLRAYCNETQDNWAKLLPMREFAYNNSQHAATKMSPFLANSEWHLKLDFEVSKKANEAPAVTNLKQKMQKLDEVLKNRVQTVNQQYAEQYDAKREQKSYNVRNRVWLNAHNIQTYLLNRKLGLKRFEPFQIIDKIEKQAYKLDIPAKWRIHPVFNVLLLKPFKSSSDYANQSQEDGFKSMKILEKLPSKLEYKVEELMNSKRNLNTLYYLVKWKDYDESENTWEPAGNLQHLATNIRAFHKANPMSSGWKGTAVNTQAY